MSAMSQRMPKTSLFGLLQLWCAIRRVPGQFNADSEPIRPNRSTVSDGVSPERVGELDALAGVAAGRGRALADVALTQRA